MSTDYSFSTTVGFSFSIEEMRKKFGISLPEKSHLEDRWDPKTGASAPPEKVVDREASDGFAIDGVEYGDDEYQEFCEALAEKLECEVSLSEMHGEPGDVVFGFRDPKRIDDGVDFGHIGTSGGLPVDGIVKQIPQYRKLDKKLRKLGLRPGKLGVFIVYYVG